MTNPRNLLVLLVAVLGLSGCLYEKPLSSTPSTNIDTRLLGVFEFSEKVRKRDAADEDASGEDAEEKENVQRVAILPHGESRYIIYYRDYSKSPVQTLTFIGWITRVDNDYYLSYRDDTPGSETFGRYGFLKFEWKWPGSFMVYMPDSDAFAGVPTSYAMRQMLRTKRKDGTLFPYQGTFWERIARVWWDQGNPDPLTTVPKEFETGRDEKGPLL